MMEPRRKKKTSSKWVIAIPVILVLISSILVFNGRVLSNLWGVSRNVVFEGQSWNMVSGSFNQNWMTNKENITFTVDLSDDFANASLTPPAERPFNVMAAHDGNQVTGITYQEVGGDQFAGKYTVNVPFSGEGRLDLQVEMLENEAWGTKSNVNAFSITRDATAPEVTLSGISDGELSTKEVTVDVAVMEKYFTSNDVTVTATRNGKNYTNLPAWKNTAETSKNSYSFSQEGEYILTVKAVDAVGNAGPEKKISFSIRTKGPVLSVLHGGEQLSGEEVTNAKQLDLKLTSGISLGTATVAIFKDGKELETKNMPVSGWEATLSYPVAADGQYEFRVWAKESHRSGQEYNLTPFKFVADQTSPTLTIEGVSEGQDYDAAREITATVEDVHYSTASLEVTRKDITGKETTTPITLNKGKATFKTEEDGEYTVTLAAADGAGNSAEKSVRFKIDQSKPAFSLSEDVNGKYFNTDKDLTIEVFDITLDLTKTALTVKKDTENYLIGLLEKLANLFKAQVKHTFTQEGKYEISLSSTDGLGHSDSIQPVTFTIDKTAPQLTVENVVKTEEQTDGPPKESRDLKISVSDTNMDWEQTKIHVTRNDAEFLSKTGKDVPGTHSFTEDGNYIVNIESTDKAGNTTKHEEIKFTIDNTKPELKIFGVEHNGHYPKLENLEISIQDLTFLLSKTELVVKKDGEDFNVGDGNWNESLTPGGLRKAIRKLSFTEEGDYEISLTSTDFLGFENSLGPVKFTIDYTAPVVEAKGIADGAFIQKGNSVTIKVKEHNFKFNDVDIAVLKDGEVYSIGEWENTAEDSALSHQFDEDGDYELSVKAKDKAGNEAEEQKLHFTVDNVEPEVKVTGVTDGKFYNGSREVNISVEERNFANNKVDLKVTRKVEVDGVKMNYSIGEWKNVAKLSELGYKFEKDGDYEIIVSSKDAAGNEAAEQKILFTIDQVEPELSITGVEDDHNYRTDKQVNIRISDRNVDLSQTNLRVSRNGKTYGIGAPELSGKTTAVKNFTFKEEGSYVINLDTADKAGNKKKHDQIAFIIDKTNPVVNIDGVENNSFNPSGKKVTISIDELNFATNKVDVSATKDGSSFKIGTWKNSGKLSKLGYNFTQDGLYTILATATDKAGNGPVTKKMTFTVDKVKPAIEIKGVENNAYYNVDKPVSVAIRDVNLDINKITVTRNGAGYGVGGFSVRNGVASLSHNFSKEGDYSILVEATDKAGNSFSSTMKFTIDKTKPVITPKFKGENRVIKNGEFINKVFTPEFALDESEDMIVSATLNNGPNLGRNVPVAAREMKYTYKVLARDKAGNETTLEISFTLDTTKPKLDISGVLDGFFNKDIAPKVTYSDIHLDSSKTSVTLNGKPFKNGMKLEYEQDYILKAVVTDLAENVTTRTIVFTIDKTSPVIKFKEPISNKYFNTDLLPQLLIEDMSAYDIIAMMLDGKPYEAGDPIKEEGKHVMFFEVKDKAGNIQQLSVEFIIDKTAPKVVVEGVKEKEKYYDPVDITIRLDNPNDTLKSVEINGELFKGDVTEENGYQVIKTKLAEIKPYKIKVTAYDDAGNEKSKVISFEIVKKGALVKFVENKPLLGGTLAGAIGLIAAAATVLVRRRKVKVEEE
ncbi:MAG: Ig-like domain-containing protein [Mesobacillus sp.]